MFEMKVLYIAYVSLSSTGGAPIEARKIYAALMYAKKTVQDFQFRVISLDDSLPEAFPKLKLGYTKRDAIISRMLGHSYYMYWFWKRNKKQIMAYEPDFVILGRSNLGFIAKDIKHSYSKVKVITDVDNIEVDYLKAWRGEKMPFLKTIGLTELEWSTKRDERRCIEDSDWNLFLTERNYLRVKELYFYAKKNYTILPICINKPYKGLSIKSDKRYVAFYGTLDYEPNRKAIKQFILTVWKPYFENSEKVQLIIAGKNPTRDLLQLLTDVPNVILYPNFNALTDILPQNTMTIAPLHDGAGMKTKVTEALSYGMLVVASDEAWIGYEAIEGLSQGVKIANTPLEYKRIIQDYIELPENDLIRMQRENVSLFEQYYSYNVSNAVITKLLLDLNAQETL